jgi:hypothetical protein
VWSRGWAMAVEEIVISETILTMTSSEGRILNQSEFKKQLPLIFKIKVI